MSNREACGRPAEWIVISDVRDGGAGFVATCRECYKRDHKILPGDPDDLVRASVFAKDFGRAPMCGDDDESSQFLRVTAAVAEPISEDVATHREIGRLLVERDIRAKVHRIAIERRFQRLEHSIGALSLFAGAALGIYVADRAVGELPQGSHWVWWLIFLAVSFCTNRLIRLGRWIRYPRIK